MIARRSASDPISPYLEAGERVVWRHQPDARTLLYNRLPSLVLVLVMTVFICWLAALVIGDTLPDEMPTEFNLWLLFPALFIGFALYLVYSYLVFLWRGFSSVLDSWSSNYALTNRRFLVVSDRGVVDYDASYFEKIEALEGAPGAQILLFDWGPSGRRRRDSYRDRIAALPDAKALERLIRETLHP